MDINNTNQLRKLCSTNIKDYIKLMNPDFIFSKTGLHDELCNLITSKIEQGNARIAISIPPRHGKSTIISQNLTSYYFAANPSHEVMTISYSSDLASEFGMTTRKQMSSDLYEHLYPDSVPLGTGTSGSNWKTVSDGKFRGVGIGGSITGFGANLMQIDDVVKNRATAHSTTFKKQIRQFFGSTIFSRILPGGSVIILMTRWTSDDLVGMVTQELGWEYVNLPAIAESNDPLGRKPGEALFPEFYPVKRLMEIKKSCNPIEDWECLYQGNPPDSKTPDYKLLLDHTIKPAIAVYHNGVLGLYNGYNLIEFFYCETITEIKNVLEYKVSTRHLLTSDKRLTHPGLNLGIKVSYSAELPDYLPELDPYHVPRLDLDFKVLSNLRYYDYSHPKSQSGNRLKKASLGYSELERVIRVPHRIRNFYT